MKVDIAVVRRMCPTLPTDPRQIRELLELSGMECDALVEDGDGRWIADVELLANRGDHRGYWGIAVELSARLSAAAVFPAVRDLAVTAAAAGPAFDDATILFATLGFEGNGLALVELANEVGVELGQPMHVFDADALSGPLRVRRSRPGDTADLIGSGDTIELSEGVLVVADDAGVVAIAGVLGCRHASATAATTRTVVEAAGYDPVAVRIAASTLGLSTTASQRIERGVDRDLAIPALRRLALLAAERAVATPAGHIELLHDTPRRSVVVRADAAAAARLLGADVSPEDFADRLGLLGFEPAGDGAWAVPSWRVWDVERPADLYEEYARAIGYDELPERIPRAGLGAPLTSGQQGRAAVTSVLHADGFYEVVTPGTYSPAAFAVVAARLPAGHPLHEHVRTLNAQASEDALLKNNSVVHALAAVDENVRQGDASVKLYEFTRLFVPDPTAENGVTERPIVWAVAHGAIDPWDWAGRSADASVHTVLGIAERCAAVLERRYSSVAMADDHPIAPLLHPFRRATVFEGGRKIGWVGELHPDLSTGELQAHRTVVLQLDSDPLTPAPPTRAIIATAPPVVRMLDFVLRNADAADALSVLRAEGPPWLRDVYVSDVFRPEGLDQDELSVTFTVEFDPARERRADDVNEVTETMRAAVVKTLGSQRVRAR